MSKIAELQVPEDLKQCQQMIVQMHEQILSLEARLNTLLKTTYGRKSESWDNGQLRLFAPEEHSVKEEKTEEKPAIEVKAHGRRRPNKELPRTQIIYDIPEQERACPGCGIEREIIGEEVTEQYDYVPSSIQVIEHVRRKRACRQCAEHVIIAPKPKGVIEKGLATAGMLAYVAVSKMADHLPLHRLEGIFKREGAQIHRSTMCDWLAAVATILLPLYLRMKELVLTSEIIWTDDTPVKMQDKEHERNIRRARVWVYLGDTRNPYTVFDFTQSWSRDGPVNFLGVFKGYLQADAFNGYDCIYAGGSVKEVACWAHARRKFYEAQTTNQTACSLALTLIGKLYDLEKKARDLTVEARYQTRLEKACPVLNEIKKWLDEQKLVALPQSPLGKAVTYTLNNWDALHTYTERGDLTIDNNKSENALRATAVGRKNWLFVGSAQGGRTAAILSSFISTCKAHNINPRAYLQDVLIRLANGETNLDALLPGNWRPCI